MVLRLFINPPWSPGGCEEAGKGGNHRNRPGFNITANSHPLVRSSQTVHTRDPPIRCERCLLPGRFLEGPLSNSSFTDRTPDSPCTETNEEDERTLMDVFISFLVTPMSTIVGNLKECRLQKLKADGWPKAFLNRHVGPKSSATCSFLLLNDIVILLVVIVSATTEGGAKVCKQPRPSFHAPRHRPPSPTMLRLSGDR